VAVHRFGNYVNHLPRGLARKPLVLAYRTAYIFCRNFYGVEIPYSAKLGRRVVFEHQGAVVIHGASVIGDDCIIRQGVTLGNRYLDQPMSAPVLGNGVNVGAGAKLLGGVRIGDGACVGANSVVLRNVDPDTTVVGIPAKPVLVSKEDRIPYLVCGADI
jgi:serine O-acetyltransferase